MICVSDCLCTFLYQLWVSCSNLTKPVNSILKLAKKKKIYGAKWSVLECICSLWWETWHAVNNSYRSAVLTSTRVHFHVVSHGVHLVAVTDVWPRMRSSWPSMTACSFWAIETLSARNTHGGVGRCTLEALEESRLVPEHDQMCLILCEHDKWYGGGVHVCEGSVWEGILDNPLYKNGVTYSRQYNICVLRVVEDIRENLLPLWLVNGKPNFLKTMTSLFATRSRMLAITKQTILKELWTVCLDSRPVI